MRHAIVLAAIIVSSLGCGESEPEEPASEPTAPAPTADEPTPEPAVLPTVPPPSAPSGLIMPPLVMTADEGGVVFHESAFVRFGDGPTEVLVIRSNACAAGRCTFTSDRCRGSTTSETTTLPAGSWSSTTVETESTAPEDAAFCARFAGVFRSGHPSDPAAGGPPPAPTFEGSSCLLRTQVASVDREVCATFTRSAPLAGGPSTTYEVTTYQGACCLGTEITRMALPNDVATAFVGPDGQSIVVARHEPAITREELANDPVLFLVARTDRSTEYRMSQLFEGDPVLTGGSGFGYTARVRSGAILVRPVGGTEHATAF